MSRLRLIAGLLVAVAALAVAASALAGPAVEGSAVAGPAVAGAAGGARAQTAGTAIVNATLGISGHGTRQRLRLTITLNGAPMVDETITSRACPRGCTAVGLGRSPAPLRVVALQAKGVPDVVVGLYTGGAHCCFVDQVYSLDVKTQRFTKTEHDFLDSGARILDLNGDHGYEFLSADARIAEAGFTDYAHSAAPLQIFSFSNGAFRDITGTYPSRLKNDAAKWLALFHRQHGNGRGLIAAWAADEDRLGHPGLVISQLAKALKAGELGVPASFRGPSPTRFVAELQALLRRLGYTR